MSFDTLRKPSAKPLPSSQESEERRRQQSGSTPTTKSPDSTIPRYLRAQLGMPLFTEREKQEDPRSRIPRHLWGELDRISAPAPKFPAAPTTAAPAAAAPAHLGKSEPLAPEAATRFSRAYGQDLSGVRVHPDSPLPGALGARALAVGNDIAFARDAYQPGSSEGQQLLGHELAHVVQQSKGRTGLQAEGLSSDGYERQADDAARAALAGQPIAELSPLATPTLQRKAADAPPPAAPAGSDKPRPGKVPVGVVDLSKGLLEPARISPDADGRVLACLPGLAQGEIALEQRGEGYSTRGEGYALPLALGPLAGMFGDSLVLVVRIDNNVISGRASVGKPGPSVPKGDSALFRAIEKSPEALGWVGLSKLSVGTPKNALEGGSLKLGADAARFTLGGFVDGTANVSVEGDRVTFSGSAEVKLPGASAGTFQVNYAPDKGLFGEAHLEVGLGKVSGGVDARLQQGVLDIQGTVGYAGDRLKGSITLMATDAATAREITRKPPQGGGLPGQESGGAAAGAGAGAGAGAAPAAAKPGPRAFCGWGELDFTLTDWLTGKVKVVVNSEGEATVQGEIAPPSEIILFEQKDWTKSLVKAEARAIYGIPVVGNVFVFANVGLEALATIGPGKLYNIKMSGQYSTDKKADKELNLQASLNISAFAGLRLRAEGGAGVELLDHDIKFGVGVWALAGVRGYVEATPAIGYREKGGGPGEFYIQGHMELAAQPFLGLGGDLFVEVDSPYWSLLPDDKWTWPLGSIEYPLPGAFGLGADVGHVLGSKQWPEIQFTEVEFDTGKFMGDLLSQSAPGKGKGGEDKKPAKWDDGGAAGAPGGGGKGAGGKGAAASGASPSAGGPQAGGKSAGGPKPTAKSAPGGSKKPNGKDPKTAKDAKGPQKDAKGPQKDGKGAALGQVGEVVPFAAAGESHRLWIQVQGKSANLMIAQPAQNAGAWLGMQEKKLAALDPAQQSKAEPLVSQARQLASTIDREADQAVAAGSGAKAQAQQTNEKLKKDERRLGGVLRQLLLFTSPQGSQAVLSLPVSMAGVGHTLFIKLGASPVVELASKRDLLSNKVGRARGRLIKQEKELKAVGKEVPTKLKEQIRDLQDIGTEAKRVQQNAVKEKADPRKDLSGYAKGKEVPGFEALRGLIATYSEYYQETDLEGHLYESVSEPLIYRYVGKQIAKRGTGGEPDTKLVTHIKGYRISLVNNRVTIAHLKESNPDTPAVHLDEAGVLRLGARSPDKKEDDPEARLADYRELASIFAKNFHITAPPEPKWSTPPTDSELREYRVALREAVVAKYLKAPLSVFDTEVLSSAVIPPKHNKMRGVIFESWIIQTGRGVRGDPKPHFATADYPGLNADVRRLPDGWILNPDHITLVDTKAMQVTTLKSGAPTASGPDEKAISQAQDYGHITSLEAEWVHVTPEGTRIPLPCTKVRYYFNNQVVADIWCPKLRRYIEPERLESEPAPRT